MALCSTRLPLSVFWITGDGFLQASLTGQRHLALAPRLHSSTCIHRLLRSRPQSFLFGFSPKDRYLRNFLRTVSDATADSKRVELQPLGTKDKLDAENKLKRRIPVDYSQVYTDNIFIPAVRAMNDYLLKPQDLDTLRKTTKRSPVTDSPPLTVYLRRDVEQKAIEVWGSLEALKREKRKRRDAEVEYNLQVSNVKRLLRDISRGKGTDAQKEDRDAFHTERLKGSKRVVYSAIVINAGNTFFKFLAWMHTGSHSMFAETVHSFADTCNQIILGIGLMGSTKKADKLHPYGYSSLRYVSSLVSGLGIFFFGFGVSVYHGVTGLINPVPPGSLYWAFFVLAGSLISEGGTLMVAIAELRKQANKQQMSFFKYVMQGQDPNVNVVLLEDLAAVAGVGIAAVSMGLASYYHSHLPDVIGSLCIGGVLGIVASFIIYTNTIALVGRSIPLDIQQQMTMVLESDVMVRSVYDVKAIDLGGMNIRYKAEIDFDGRQLTRSYLDKQDLERMMEEAQNIKTIEGMEIFMTKHGENIVDLLGSEVDRIEGNLKRKYPEVRHVDLEVL